MTEIPEGIEIEEQPVRVAGLDLKLQIPKDFEKLLEYYAQHFPEGADLIPYHGILWPSSLALADHLASRFPTMAGIDVVELGCGLGLPSIVAARRGARVTATDFHPGNPQFVLRNAEVNGATVEYRRLPWTSPPEGLTFGVVMGSDLVYQKTSLEALVDCSTRLCAPEGKIILSDPGREFLQLAVSMVEDRGFASAVWIVRDCFVVEFERRG